jgi:RNA polymerase sigma-70 factor (ECF subfamily)
MHDGEEKLELGRNQTVAGAGKLPAFGWHARLTRGHNRLFPPVMMNFTDTTSDDAAVINNTLRGNTNSFEILVDRYQEHVGRIVRNHVPRDEAPEVAHNTFVRAYQSLGGFKGTGPFKHWLAKIAIRCCQDFWRGYYQNRENLAGPLPDECRDWVGQVLSDEAAAREAEKVEARDLLEWALGHLSVSERTVLTLTHLNEYSAAEAAELLDWSVIRIKVQAHRARKKLRKILTEVLPQGIA